MWMFGSRTTVKKVRNSLTWFSHLYQVAKCLTMQLAMYLAKEVAAILPAVLTHDTKKLHEGTAFAMPYSLHIRSCSIHRPDTMRPGQEKGIDPAVAWPGLLHTLGRPRNGSHQLLAPDFVIGLVVFAMWTLCRYGFRPTGPPVVLQQLQHKEDSYRAAHPSRMDQESLRLILESNGRRQGPIGACSSRLAIVEMLTEKATFVC